MATVIVRAGESLDNALRRFKRACNKDHIKEDCRKHEYYMSRSQKRRVKHNKVMQRIKKRAEK